MKKIYALFLFTFLFAFGKAQYCSTGTLTSNHDLSITNVSLGNYSHNFSDDTLSYYDFTQIDTILLSVNLQYQLSIHWQKSFNVLNAKIVAYLDYNNDSTFSTTTDLLGSATVFASSNAITTFNFTIPQNSKDNTLTRLRIRFFESGLESPCGNLSSSIETSRDYLVRYKNCISFSSFRSNVDTTLCDSLLLVAPSNSDPNLHYQWSTNDTNSSIIARNVLKYFVEVTNDSGCYYKTTFNVMKDSIVVNFGYTTSWSPGMNMITYNFVNNSIGSNHYIWEVDNVQVSTDSIYSMTVSSSGGYNVSLTGYNDCGKSNKITKFVRVFRESIIESESLKFNLSPNPTSATLTLQMDKILNDESAIIRILDALGKEEKLLRTNLSNGKMSIDVSQLSNGLHFLELQTSKGNSIQKFVKK